MKAFNLVLAFIFIIFALLQYNDSNPLMWMTAYGVAAVLSFFAASNRTFRLANIAMIVFISIWLVVSIPTMIDIIITGSAPKINGIVPISNIKYFNEFFGLIIIMLAMFFQLKATRTHETAQ